MRVLNFQLANLSRYTTTLVSNGCGGIVFNKITLYGVFVHEILQERVIERGDERNGLLTF